MHLVEEFAWIQGMDDSNDKRSPLAGSRAGLMISGVEGPDRTGTRDMIPICPEENSGMRKSVRLMADHHSASGKVPLTMKLHKWLIEAKWRRVRVRFRININITTIQEFCMRDCIRSEPKWNK